MDESTPTEPVTYHDDGTATVQLQKPLQPIPSDVTPGKRKMLEAEEVDTISLRPAYAGDLVAVDGVTGDNARALKLIASLSGVSYSTLCRLSLTDLNNVTAALDHVLGK